MVVHQRTTTLSLIHKSEDIRIAAHVSFAPELRPDQHLHMTTYEDDPNNTAAYMTEFLFYVPLMSLCVVHERTRNLSFFTNHTQAQY